VATTVFSYRRYRDASQARKELAKLSMLDSLTGLPNRRSLPEWYERGVSRAIEDASHMAVLFVDLDHFKTINDTLGHTAGDELLLEMSRRLRDCIREDDTVARLGGDEFTIILGELRHSDDAVQVAEKILEAVAVPLWISGMPIEMTASIGIALFPADGADAEALLRNADSAMYRAKESGRNNYQLWTNQITLP